MVITLAIFYYLYLGAILLFFILGLFNIYHLLRFGFLSWVNISIILVYILISAGFLLWSLNLLINIDWNTVLIDFSVSANNSFGL